MEFHPHWYQSNSNRTHNYILSTFRLEDRNERQSICIRSLADKLIVSCVIMYSGANLAAAKENRTNSATLNTTHHILDKVCKQTAHTTNANQTSIPNIGCQYKSTHQPYNIWKTRSDYWNRNPGSLMCLSRHESITHQRILDTLTQTHPH